LLKKLLLVALIGVGVGIVAYRFFGAIPFVSTLKPIVTPIYNTWMRIPEAVRNIVMMGIPTAFGLFFMWTKNRAMQKLQQTQVEASQSLTQLQGEKLELEGTVKGYEQVYGKTVTGEIKGMATELRDAQNALTVAKTEISVWQDKQKEWFQTRSRLEDERNYLTRRVKELEAQLSAKPRAA